MTRSLLVRRAIAPALAAFAASLLVACTSAGDGGTLGSTRRGTYTSSATVPPGIAPYVFLSQENSGSGVVCLAVNVRRASNLYSVSFTLTYDPAVMKLVSADPVTRGPFLGTAGQTLLEWAPDPPEPGVADRVVVGLTRRDDVVATGVSGDGKIATICFTLLTPATAAPVSFVSNRVGEDPAGVDVIPDDPAFWLGGAITVE